jgi:hypothetical protein
MNLTKTVGINADDKKRLIIIVENSKLETIKKMMVPLSLLTVLSVILSSFKEFVAHISFASASGIYVIYFIQGVALLWCLYYIALNFYLLLKRNYSFSDLNTIFLSLQEKVRGIEISDISELEGQLTRLRDSTRILEAEERQFVVANGEIDPFLVDKIMKSWDQIISLERQIKNVSAKKKLKEKLESDFSFLGDSIETLRVEGCR